MNTEWLNFNTHVNVLAQYSQYWNIQCDVLLSAGWNLLHALHGSGRQMSYTAKSCSKLLIPELSASDYLYSSFYFHLKAKNGEHSIKNGNMHLSSRNDYKCLIIKWSSSYKIDLRDDYIIIKVQCMRIRTVFLHRMLPFTQLGVGEV